MIFQEPMSSLNPSLTVGLQIAEPMQLHRGMSWKKALDKAKELLSRVRIPDAASRVNALSASVLGRHAPARDDRDGARLQAQADHCG